MGGRNQSIVKEFILQGYSSSQKVQLFLFVVLLHVYIMTIASNILIILSVKSDPKLHSPMYYFLSHFSFVDTCYISTTVPKMLFDLLKEHKSISAAGCLAQFYFFMSFGVTEDLLLTVMALDRYIAICRPLHYNSLMSPILCRQLTLISYIVSFLVVLVPVMWISTLSFCCPNSIDHFICDFSPLLNLSCTDASLIELTFMIIECIIIVFCCVMVMISYTFIILTIARMPTITGRKKAFSTCGSHLIVVTVFYGTLMFVYIRPASKSSFSFDKVAPIVFSVVVPFFNPIIYSLRNTEMKQAMRRAMKPLLRFWKK